MRVGGVNEIDHHIFSLADPLWQEKYVTLSGAGPRSIHQQQEGKVQTTEMSQNYCGFAFIISSGYTHSTFLSVCVYV